MKKMPVLLFLIALLTLAFAFPADAKLIKRRTKEDQISLKEIEAKKQAAKDKAYKGALDTVPNKKPVDPWGSIR
jgi:hypothetical protein